MKTAIKSTEFPGLPDNPDGFPWVYIRHGKEQLSRLHLQHTGVTTRTDPVASVRVSKGGKSLIYEMNEPRFFSV